jgi:hypothetical protein
MKLVLFKEKHDNYCEDSQKINLTYSFLKRVGDDTFEEIFLPFKCRDYFSDCVVGNALGIRVEKYGFVFDPENTPLDQDNLLLSIHGSSNLLHAISKNLDILHGFETELNLPLTTFTPLEDGLAILTASNYWQETAIRLNIYTLLLKSLAHKHSEEMPRNLKGLVSSMLLLGMGNNLTTEASYYKQIHQILSKFDYATPAFFKDLVNTSGCYDVFAGEKPYSIASAIHSTCGILSVANVIDLVSRDSADFLERNTSLWLTIPIAVLKQTSFLEKYCKT